MEGADDKERNCVGYDYQKSTGHDYKLFPVVKSSTFHQFLRYREPRPLLLRFCVNLSSNI